MRSLSSDRRDFQTMRLREINRTCYRTAPALHWEPEFYSEVRRAHRTRPLVGPPKDAPGPSAQAIERQRQTNAEHEAFVESATPQELDAHYREEGARRAMLESGWDR